MVIGAPLSAKLQITIYAEVASTDKFKLKIFLSIIIDLLVL
jgi:hypothetical protein